MDGLWCNFGHSMAEREKNTGKPMILDLCTGEKCERWKGGACSRLERVRNGERVLDSK